LKDGSFQSVTKYEVKGDRVRYLSAERDEWEEIPTSLIDWTATEKYEKDRAAGAASPEAAAVDKEIDAERELDQARLPQVAPGLRLPEDSGVFLLDNFNGEPQLVEMEQSEGDINQRKKTNLILGAINPVAGSKQTVELDGEHAKIQAHVPVPSIYLNVEDAPEPAEKIAEKSGDGSHAEPQRPQQTQQPQHPVQAIVPFDRFRIVRAEAKGGKRTVGDIKRAVTGKISQDQKVVKSTITEVTGGWLKLTPIEDLPPGEYVIVETKGAEGMNLYMWDFGVNPKAPANTNPWKPDTKKAETPKPKANL
ncbi:MAG: hypothetical protein WB562_05390, partial [Candidatus Sulfotelmatobacter sp.]